MKIIHRLNQVVIKVMAVSCQKHKNSNDLFINRAIKALESTESPCELLSDEKASDEKKTFVKIFFNES